jgi:RNA ligase
VSTTIDLEKIEQLVLDGYISKRSHFSGEIFIYNYTAKAQYERVWTPETMQCRGLILDMAGTVVARPLPKFFNLEEYTDGIPQEPFEVYEKLDGSLGILYWYDRQPFIASRGSFNSDQAVKANELLNTVYAEIIPELDPKFTYLFEIIYPENRIVVNYGTEQSLILLAVIETATGNEIPLEQFVKQFGHLGLAIAKKYDGIQDLAEITKLNQDNREGFVIRFASGLRLKFKFADYVRLHRVLTQISTKVIWEMLKDRQPFEEILERVPDEFYAWVKSVKAALIQQYQEVEEQAKRDFKILGDRKETAMYFLTCPNHKILFAMLDGKDYSDYLWRLIKPVTEKPFVQDEES